MPKTVFSLTDEYLSLCKRLATAIPKVMASYNPDDLAEYERLSAWFKELDAKADALWHEIQRLAPGKTFPDALK